MARYFTRTDYTPGSMSEIIHDFYSGAYVGASHFVWLVYDTVTNKVARPVGVALHLIDPTDPKMKERLELIKAKGDQPGLKVIGVGYGRTGTFSLTVALEELGYPTLHTQHLYENPTIMDMWAEKVFLPSLKANKVLRGEPDLNMIAQSGYQATTDLPMALYFEEIAEQYPDCKFILTTRESSEIWFKSWDTMTSMIKQPAAVGYFIKMPHITKLGYYMRWLFSTVSQDNKFLTASFPLPAQIKENSINSYETHNRRVREIIPSDRLLEYNVKEGYGPLCDFLNVPTDECPTQAFPKSNSARSVKVQAISSILFPLTVTLFVLCMIFRAVTGKNVIPWIREKSLNCMRRMGIQGLPVKEKTSTRNVTSIVVDAEALTGAATCRTTTSSNSSTKIGKGRKRIKTPASPTTVAAVPTRIFGRKHM